MAGKASIGILIFLLLACAFIGIFFHTLKADSDSIIGSGQLIKK